MTDTADATRHTPVETLTAYQDQGIPGVFPIAGTPQARIRFEPARRRLSLLIEVTDEGGGPDVSTLANVTCDQEAEGDQMWHRLDITYADNLPEVYAVVCRVADRTQLDELSFADAVDAALAGLENILEGRGELSPEKQTGLFGELCILWSLAAARTVQEAMDSWIGPRREEHDFGLSDADLEVKTTTSEARTHWIDSATQLVPSSGRKLYLVSVQITAAGAGPGASLAELVGATRRLATTAGIQLDAALFHAGYRDAHEDLYQKKWSLRSRPSFFAVDDSFPAVTLPRLADVVPDSQRVAELRYRINLDGRPTAPSLFPVTIPGIDNA